MIVRHLNRHYSGTPTQIVEFLKRQYIRYQDSKTNKQYRTGAAKRVRQMFEQEIDTHSDLTFLNELERIGEITIIRETTECVE
jgi:hypothetical protein